MTDESSSAARDELLDAVRLWRVAPGTHAADVIDAATEGLVVGLDSALLRELAGASPQDSHFVFEPMVVTTMEELDLAKLLEPDLEVAAMSAMARRLSQGRATPRELASWAHHSIGYTGSARCRPFVDAFYLYEEAEYDGLDTSGVDVLVRKDADALLSGDDFPALSVEWPPIPRGSSGGSARRRSRILRRPRWSRRK